MLLLLSPQLKTMPWRFAFEELGSYPRSEEEWSSLFPQSLWKKTWGNGNILHGRVFYVSRMLAKEASVMNKITFWKLLSFSAYKGSTSNSISSPPLHKTPTTTKNTITDTPRTDTYNHSNLLSLLISLLYHFLSNSGLKISESFLTVLSDLISY